VYRKISIDEETTRLCPLGRSIELPRPTADASNVDSGSIPIGHANPPADRLELALSANSSQ
jgi:hypothetical protein